MSLTELAQNTVNHSKNEPASVRTQNLHVQAWHLLQPSCKQQHQQPLQHAMGSQQC